jgi:hypothetical protein
VLIYLGAVSNPGGGESAGAPAAAAPSAAGAASPGSSLTAADVDALLRGIAQGGSDSGLALPSSRTPREFASPQPAASSDAQAAVQCLRSGAGLTAADQTIEIFDAAFEHTPAYIGVFRTQGGQQITAVVVSLSGCQPLYVASQPR